MLRRTSRAALILLSILLLLVTTLPFIPSNAWWIRVWDFPRAQIGVLLLLAGIGVALSFPIRRPTSAALLTLLALAAIYQAWCIYPYTPLHQVQALEAQSCSEADRLRVLVSNVLIENRDSGPVVELMRRIRPDLALFLETDSWWDRHLAPLKAVYPHVVAQPQDDSYGMHLFSQLPLIQPQVRFLLEDYVPSIMTQVELRSGKRIDFHGVHPMPPPLDDTAERDAELLLVGREIRSGRHPAVIAGDLNDVAWSQTTRQLQEISGLLDPRIGRGLYPSFSADWPLLRWPLDHVFFEEGFVLLEMRVLPDIGSDHFPIYVALCHRPEVAAIQAKPNPEPEDLQDAAKAIRAGREEAKEPD